jgi:uncharacterized protein (TIGR02452 family)
MWFKKILQADLMKQSTRIQIAKDTLEILKRGFYLNPAGARVEISHAQAKAEDHTRLYTPGELEEMNNNTSGVTKFETVFEVTNETTLDAARRLIVSNDTNPACLNFASAKNPGGGFLNGALAQEECIARATGLYLCQHRAKEYYSFHRGLNTCLYSDHMIYSPEVPVLKDEEGNLLPSLTLATIITSSAVNAGVIRRNEISKIDQIVPLMRKRVEKLLALCLHHQHETIVLGAWGCGVFQNDPEEIAELFAEALGGKFRNQFKRVVFAVYTKNENMIEPFRKRFDKK